MNLGGNLHISLQRQLEPQVAVSLQKPHAITQLLEGKPLNQGLETIGLLFNVCRQAQVIAAVRAAEKALNLQIPPVIERGRNQLIQLEMLHEQLWNTLMELPKILEIDTAQKCMISVSKNINALIKALDANQRLTRLNPADDNLELTQHSLDNDTIMDLRQLLFGADINMPESLEALRTSKGLTTELLSCIEALDWTYQTPSNHKQNNSPITTPTKSPAETGAFQRQSHHLLVSKPHEQGKCLAPRLLAQLLEISYLLQHHSTAEQTIDYGHSKRLSNKSGYCSMVTARGQLSHTVQLSDHENEPIIQTMTLVSPTDQNFHRHGAAKLLLEQLLTIEDKRGLLTKRAEVLTKLLNPCIDYEINFIEDDNGATCYA
jgi:coenzyme F420-reducing hydrogenase alpha subunit